jgi:hypothetical protein
MNPENEGSDDAPRRFFAAYGKFVVVTRPAAALLISARNKNHTVATPESSSGSS